MVERAPLFFFRSLLVAALASPLILLPSSAPADCGGPFISLSRGFVNSDQPVTVQGEAWTDGCNDSSGFCGFTGDPVEPLTGVRITLERKHDPLQEWAVDGPDFEQTIETAGLPDGDYRVVAEHGDWQSGERFTIRRK